jgi:hypothetical protein
MLQTCCCSFNGSRNCQRCSLGSSIIVIMTMFFEVCNSHSARAAVLTALACQALRSSAWTTHVCFSKKGDKTNDANLQNKGSTLLSCRLSYTHKPCVHVLLQLIKSLLANIDIQTISPHMLQQSTSNVTNIICGTRQGLP